MPRGGRGRPCKMSIPKSLTTAKANWKALLEKVQKDGKAWMSSFDKSKIVTPAGVSHVKHKTPSEQLQKDAKQSDSLQSPPLPTNNPDQVRKMTTILQEIWKSTLPNLNSVTQKSQATKTNSSYIEMANAIAKDSQALNSRVEKMSKHAKTVESVIERFQGLDNKGENLDLSQNGSSTKKSSFWITTAAPGLYFLIMEQLPKLLFHSENTSDD